MFLKEHIREMQAVGKGKEGRTGRETVSVGGRNHIQLLNWLRKNVLKIPSFYVLPGLGEIMKEKDGR